MGKLRAKLTENPFKNLSSLMQPIGFNKKGEQLYSLKPLAVLFGVSHEELIKQAKKTSGVALYLPEEKTNKSVP